MGMWLQVIEGQIEIPAFKQAAALASLKAKRLQVEQDFTGEEEGEILASDPFYKVESLREALDYFSLDTYEDEEGWLYITGYENKQTDGIDAIGSSLAGFAEAGSHLVFKGEGAELWRWYYTAKKFYLQNPSVTWPEVPADEDEEQGNG